jgi:hypothetical protein
MIISLNNITRLVFVIETRCVLFEVGTDFLDIIWINFMLQMDIMNDNRTAGVIA